MRQTVIIVAAILGAGVLIAIALGLALGLRSSVEKPENGIECHPPTKPTPPPTTPTPAPQKDEAAERYEAYRARKYRKAAVTARVDVCAKIGMDVLVARGGSAVDAAIATSFCTGSILLQGEGIGGGGFMTIYERQIGSTTKNITTLLAREVLPLAGYKEYFQNHSSTEGGTAIGVPSQLHGLYTAWRMYGRVPWRHLVTPSIKLCEGGFKVHKTTHNGILRYKERIVKNNNVNLKRVVARPNGTFYKEGDIIKRPLFARTLKIIADDPMSFYNGSLADDIVADIQEAGGEIVKEDLMRYQTRIRKPVSGRLKSLGLTMYAPEPPSSGVVLQYLMRLYDGFGFNNQSLKDPESRLLTFQKIVESCKFAYGQRSALGDPFFWNITGVLNNMTDDAYIDYIRGKIDTARTHDLDYYEHQYYIPDDAGTSQTSILAPDGGAVAITSSVNYYFGSQVYGTRTGIMFNNQMDDFSVPGKSNIYNIAASPSNFPEPGKVPMSSMSPIIFMTDSGEVAYISGASGGSVIISSVAYVALHNLYFGLDLKAAVSTPRLHHQLLPNEITHEDGFDEAVLAGLKLKGHTLRKVSAIGTPSTIRNLCAHGCQAGDDECLEYCIHAVADYRFYGTTYGY